MRVAIGMVRQQHLVPGRMNLIPGRARPGDAMDDAFGHGPVDGARSNLSWLEL